MNLKSVFHKEAPSDKYGTERALDQLRESRAFAQECHYDLEQLHCKGCIYSCPLIRAKCDTGKKAVPALEQLRAQG